MTQSEEFEDSDLANAVEELRAPLAGHLSRYSLQSLIGRDWVSIEQFCNLTNTPMHRAKRMVKSKELPVVKVGNQYRIYESALLSYLGITPERIASPVIEYVDPDEYSF